VSEVPEKGRDTTRRGRAHGPNGRNVLGRTSVHGLSPSVRKGVSPEPRRPVYVSSVALCLVFYGRACFRETSGDTSRSFRGVSVARVGAGGTAPDCSGYLETVRAISTTRKAGTILGGGGLASEREREHPSRSAVGARIRRFLERARGSGKHRASQGVLR